MENSNVVVLYNEAELYITSMKMYKIEDIGSEQWFQQSDWIEKLNMQALINASSNEDEYIKELLVTLEKIPLLVHEMIVTEAWKARVFPQLIKTGIEARLSFPIYMVMRYEASIVNLLETIMYHEDCCEATESVIADLVDYCHRKILLLVTDFQNDDSPEKLSSVDEMMKKSTMEQLKDQKRKMEFNICMKTLAILRYLTDHLERLPLSVPNRLLSTHDFPLLLTNVIEVKPWTRIVDGRTEKFIDCNWVTVPPEDRLQVIKVEGQVWLALFHLLMDPECQSKYEINDFRKNKIIKLIPYLSEVMLDQLPPLVSLRQRLEHLSFMEPIPAKSDVIIEQLPEIWESTNNDIDKNLNTILKLHASALCNDSYNFYDEQAKKWAATYNLDVLDKLLPKTSKCTVCGQAAQKRCSRCRETWYCGRDCQVQHWPQHKEHCIEAL